MNDRALEDDRRMDGRNGRVACLAMAAEGGMASPREGVASAGWRNRRQKDWQEGEARVMVVEGRCKGEIKGRRIEGKTARAEREKERKWEERQRRDMEKGKRWKERKRDRRKGTTRGERKV